MRKNVKVDYEFRQEENKRVEKLVIMEDGEEYYRSEVSGRQSDTPQLNLKGIVPKGTVDANSIEIDCAERRRAGI